ncbi:MAG: hypothetical protein QXX58_03350, partial [Thermofilaceae archaeon]
LSRKRSETAERSESRRISLRNLRPAQLKSEKASRLSSPLQSSAPVAFAQQRSEGRYRRSSSTKRFTSLLYKLSLSPSAAVPATYVSATMTRPDSRRAHEARALAVLRGSKVPKCGVAETVEGDSTRNLPKAPHNG